LNDLGLLRFGFLVEIVELLEASNERVLLGLFGELEADRNADVVVREFDTLSGSLHGGEGSLLRREKLAVLVGGGDGRSIFSVTSGELLLFSLLAGLLRLLLTLVRRLDLLVVVGNTSLVSVGTTASPDLAVREEEERVVVSGFELNDTSTVVVLRRESGDTGRGGDDVRPATIVLVDTGLVERVETPSVDLAVLVDREGVVGTGTDKDDVLEGEAFGSETVRLVTCEARIVSIG
jgi:hypothetical protein